MNVRISSLSADQHRFIGYGQIRYRASVRNEHHVCGHIGGVYRNQHGARKCSIFIFLDWVFLDDMKRGCWSRLDYRAILNLNAVVYSATDSAIASLSAAR